jgi:hypothetical protein
MYSFTLWHVQSFPGTTSETVKDVVCDTPDNVLNTTVASADGKLDDGTTASPFPFVVDERPDVSISTCPV